MAKKILIITYYWPPSGGAGVQRWLKTSKYLPEFGWDPVILTVEPSIAAYPQVDKSLLKEVYQELKVYYATAKDYYSIYKKVTGKQEIPYGGFANEKENNWKQKFAKFIRGNLLLPDARRGWNKNAIKKAVEIIKEHNIHYVITTSPPHSTQLIGLALKKQMNINWIVDFRDPWSDIYYNENLYQTRWAKYYEKRLEKRVVESADLIITVSKGQQHLFKSKSEKNLSQKTTLVYNGWDPQDFNQKKTTKKPDEFTIYYGGTITNQYNITGLLNAISHIQTSTNHEINMHFVGMCSKEIKEQVQHSLGEKRTTFTNYLPHSEALSHLFNASLLLLILPDTKGSSVIIPGKLFEYIGAGLPILAIGPKGSEIADILNSSKSGAYFSYEEEKKMTDFILYHYKNNIDESTFSLNQCRTQFTRKEQTRKLTKAIEHIPIGNNRLNEK